MRPSPGDGLSGWEQSDVAPLDWRQRLRQEVDATPDDGVEAVQRALRLHISDGLFTGRLAPGDRLPSIRTLAREARLNHKLVAAALRAVSDEGLLEVRERSGVYVAAGWRREDAEDPVDAVTATALTEAWNRGIPAHELVRRLGALGERPPRRCVCVDARPDYLAALARELRTMFSLSTVPVCLPSATPVRDVSAVLEEVLRDADLVACTPHVAAAVREVASARGLPVVVVTRDPAGERPLGTDSARALAHALLATC